MPYQLLCRSAKNLLTGVFLCFQGKPEMDGYLSPQPQDVVNSKMLCRDGALMLERASPEDSAPPYSINMSLLLPDVAYMHPGFCRTVRQIKTEPPLPPHALAHGSCQGNGMPPTLPEYPGVFSAADAAAGHFFIKQEVPDFQDVSLFQLLNSDLEQLIHGPQLSSIPMTPLSVPVGDAHAASTQSSSKPAAGPHNECFQRQHRPAYLPPSPPNSEPPSPERVKEPVHNLSPPPSYEASIASKLLFQTRHGGQSPTQARDQGSSVGLVQSSGPVPVHPTLTARGGPQSPVLAQSALFKSNRRNNPDLERRRIHHCDVPGASRFYSQPSFNRGATF